jgi:hypothetical protein
VRGATEIVAIGQTFFGGLPGAGGVDSSAGAEASGRLRRK